MQNLQNRKSKISFLKGLISGERNIDELRDKKLRILADYNAPKYFCDGVQIAKEEFEEIFAKIPSDKIKFNVSIQ